MANSLPASNGASESGAGPAATGVEPGPFPEPVVRSWEFPRAVTGVALLLRFAEEHGVRSDRLLHGTGIDPAVLNDPDAQLEARAELAVIGRLTEGLGDVPALGLLAGARYRVAAFGIFGFACVTSPTLREAVAFALRHLDLSFTFCIPHVRVDHGRMVLTLDDSRVPQRLRRFLVERDLAAIHQMMTDLLDGPPPLLRTTFRHRDPGYPRRYAERFGVPPEFAAPANVATMDAAVLDRPLPQANEHTAALCEQQCRELVARRRHRAGLAGQVRERLIRASGAPSGIDEVARDLAVSARTLRRKLLEEGTSYRVLLDEVRRTLAEELLRTGGLRVEDVAIRLGYAESASFISAFKRWTGRTPSAFRRSG